VLCYSSSNFVSYTLAYCQVWVKWVNYEFCRCIFVLSVCFGTETDRICIGLTQFSLSFIGCIAVPVLRRCGPMVTDGSAFFFAVGLPVGLFVCLSVCHDREPCKNGWTDGDAVLLVDSGGPKELCIRWGLRSRHGKGQFWRGKGRPIVRYREYHPCAMRPFVKLLWPLVDAICSQWPCYCGSLSALLLL